MTLTLTAALVQGATLGAMLLTLIVNFKEIRREL